MKRLQSMLCTLAASAALQAAAQAAPNLDYTDMWWNPNESGWGISIRQKLPDRGTVDALVAVWYTYDPRATDPASPGGTGSVPLWLYMTGGTWSTPTSYAGTIYATTGTHFTQPWIPFDPYPIKEVGSFRLRFTDAGHGIFDYTIAPPAGIPTTHPGYGLPTMSGTKTIERQVF
jgi:hypothetical protein